MRSDLQNKFIRNLLKFLIPVLILYIGSISLTMSVPGHLLALSDLMPNAVTVGSILTYVMNALIDFKSKLDAS